ncbi:MAG TPA: N-acetylmuramoyl-L-alanine amidase, partial [Anaerolineales bacterium]|nr:N-acetylmuramoyl-L-alanine amidase [Anaerolineales bacterium]
YSASALVSIHADSCDYINEQATGYKVTASLETQIPVESNRLVSCLISHYEAITKMNFHAGSITFDMEYYHVFRELNAKTPAAIIEVGFMNLDRDILTNNSSTVAQGVANGILCYVRDERLGTDE